MTGLLFSNIAAFAAILIIVFLRKLLKDKVFSKIFVLLWALVIFRLLLPFEFSSGASIYSPVQTPAAEISKTEDFYYSEKISEGEIFVSEGEPINFSESQISEKAKISSDTLFLFIWLSGTVFCGGSLLFRHRKNIRQILSDCVPANDIPAEFSEGRIIFYKSSSIASPLSFGIFRPVMVIPENVSEKQLPFVLLHEHTHIKDHDAVLKALALFALSINWFNPAVWFMVKLLDRDIERYCDERVLSVLGNEKAALYANTILDFAERESLSLSFFSAASLYERVTSIMNNKNKKSRFFAVFVIPAAVAFIMTACGTVPKEPEEKKDFGELIEVLESANWQFSMENQYVIDLESGNLDARVFKIIDDEENEFYSYSSNFTDLPVERIIVKDLGFSENVTAGIQCFKAHNETIGVSNYKELLECGFKIEYNNSEIVVSTEKPIGDKVPEFSLSLHVNLEETEIISENTEVFYFGMPNKNEEYSREKHAKEIRFIDEPIEENNKISSFEKTGISFVSPVDSGWIVSDAESYKTHPGIDVFCEEGTAIYAAADGEVFFVDNDFLDYGKSIAIDHGDTFSTFYGSCSEIYVEQFDHVKTGDLIAIAGSTEAGGDPHLHFELRKGKSQLDPMKLLSFANTSYEYSSESEIKLVSPVESGYVAAKFGSYKGHNGMDIASENGTGTEILAAAEGKVVKVERDNTGYGYHIIIDHGSGVQTLYAHLHDIYVELGQEVKAGEIIGTMGSTGNSTGIHLHFEIQIDGEYIDPYEFIMPS